MADVDRIAALLNEVSETHHTVYRITDGDDPDWATFYANWLVELSELDQALGMKPVRSELTYMLAWESLADRETRWTAFQNDPAWHEARDDSERDGPIVASISNQILTPTSFSALK